jgi:hypothetical protein
MYKNSTNRRAVGDGFVSAGFSVGFLITNDGVCDGDLAAESDGDDLSVFSVGTHTFG